MNKLDKDYQALLQDILYNGVTKIDRTGTGTKSIFGRQIRHKMSDGFPLLTTKKMYFKGIVTELLWFLRGDTNIKYLVDNDTSIWNGDCYKSYLDNLLSLEQNGNHTEMNKWMQLWDDGSLSLYTKEQFIEKIKSDDEFAKKWGNLGPVYGAQWRGWGTGELVDYEDSDFVVEKVIDQIQNLINDLKTNPDSRRLMVNAWNVGNLDQMVLPPCHYGFQCYTRELSDDERALLLDKKLGIADLKFRLLPYLTQDLEKHNIPKRAISLMWNQRSVDTFLGLPFNIASYGLLLEIIAKIVNMIPDELIGNLGDTHLYLNHIEQAKEQIGREMSFDERIDYCNKHHNILLAGFSEESYQLDKVFNVPTRTRSSFELPTLKLSDKFLTTIDKYNGVYKSKYGHDFGYLNDFDNLINSFENSDFTIENYQSHPTIKAPLSN